LIAGRFEVSGVPVPIRLGQVQRVENFAFVLSIRQGIEFAERRLTNVSHFVIAILWTSALSSCICGAGICRHFRQVRKLRKVESSFAAGQNRRNFDDFLSSWSQLGYFLCNCPAG
jgi:hypothetical protein